MPSHKLRICIDFDGVIHSYTSGWTGEIPTDQPVPGAADFIRALLDYGYDVVILSTRAKTVTGTNGIKAWLENNGFPNVYITDTKLPALLYIDDRAFRFTRPRDFRLLTQELQNPASHLLQSASKRNLTK